MSRRFKGPLARRREAREAKAQEARDAAALTQQRLGQVYNSFKMVDGQVINELFVHPMMMDEKQYFIGRSEGRYYLLTSDNKGNNVFVKDPKVIEEYLFLSGERLAVLGKVDSIVKNNKDESYIGMKNELAKVRAQLLGEDLPVDSAEALKRIDAILLDKAWNSSDVVSLVQSNKDFHRLGDGSKVVTADGSEYVRRDKDEKGDKDKDNLRQRLLHGLEYFCNERELRGIRIRLMVELGVDINVKNSIVGGEKEGQSTEVLEEVIGYLGTDHPFARYHRAFNQAVSEGQITTPTEDLQKVVDSGDDQSVIVVPGKGVDGRECEVKIFKDDNGNFNAIYRSKSSVGFMGMFGEEISDSVECESYVTLNLSDPNATPEVCFDLNYVESKGGPSPIDGVRGKVAGYVSAVNQSYARDLEAVKAKFNSVKVKGEQEARDEGLGESLPATPESSPLPSRTSSPSSAAFANRGVPSPSPQRPPNVRGSGVTAAKLDEGLEALDKGSTL